MSKSLTVNEVKEHAAVEKGLYIIIDGGVYEMVCMNVIAIYCYCY